MSEMTLLDLAERCEAADAPSWELNAEIAKLVEPIPDGYVHDLESMFTPKKGSHGLGYVSACYLFSLDAALALVPEDCVWMVCTDYELPGRASVWDHLMNHRSDAATPALALTAACLRARHALTLSKGSEQSVE
ncbi:MAG: hypothetical protein ABWY12_12130 [Burkholderiales bacterium]